MFSSSSLLDSTAPPPRLARLAVALLIGAICAAHVSSSPSDLYQLWSGAAARRATLGATRAAARRQADQRAPALGAGSDERHVGGSRSRVKDAAWDM